MHASRTIAAALQMFLAQQYAGVASLCADVLEGEPDNLDLRVLRVRALMALGRDDEAKRELGRILGWHETKTPEVFRLLGELAIRCSKLGAAETFLRQALRLEPDDHKVEALLALVRSSNQPTAAVEKLPAATAAVGCTFLPASSEPAPEPQTTPGRRLARGTASMRAEGSGLFGLYLVRIGALTPVQLRAALAYHRRSGLRVGAAAVALGFLSEPSVEGAARDFHVSRLGV